ncbi:hypothetical protein BGZ75_002690, partial [Mortierella antarctica]
VKLLSLRQIKDHLEPLRQPDFDPANYNEKGYVLRGSVRTDGFRLQLLGFKIKELQSVRYRRLSERVLPERVTSTVGGVDYYLSEVRNIIRTKEDVARLWPMTRPEDIKVVGMDLGQACVVGLSALLPAQSLDQPPAVPAAAPGPDPIMFHNMVVKQKAVYQPLFKLRRWTESQKGIKPPGDAQSINDIECRLPPLRGQEANV